MCVYVYLGELYDGFDEEYQCPILDEDRVSISYKNIISEFHFLKCYNSALTYHLYDLVCKCFGELENEAGSFYSCCTSRLFSYSH